MVEHSIRVRGRHQFEIVLAYPLAQNQATSYCNVQTYLFVPGALGIDRGTYEKQDFYRDLQVYSRLKTPTMTLRDIAGEDGGPLHQLTQACQETDGKVDLPRFEREVKLFCCIVRSALRDAVAAMAEEPKNRGCEEVFAEYVDNLGAILHAYRELQPLVQNVSEKLLAIYVLVDEYLSLLVEEFSFELLETTREAGYEVPAETRRRVLAFINEELSYRTDRRYPSVTKHDTNNETVLYRRGTLKKFAHSVLYLKTQQSAEGRLLEQAVFGLSAGIAMLLATGVAFAFTAYYGAISVPVFAALVVGYIFKDRIKDLLRIYLSRKLGSRIYDHRTRIRTHAGHTIGVFKESFEFIDEQKVPSEILKIRNQGRQFHIDSLMFNVAGERVMLYERTFRFSSAAVAKVLEGHDMSAMKDIMRLSILEMARKAGRPRKSLYMVGGDDYSTVRGERVHHLNVVVKLTLNDSSTTTHFRVVFNSRRIKRIDAIPVEELGCLAG